MEKEEFVSDFEISAQKKELKTIIVGKNLEKFLNKKELNNRHVHIITDC
tara:strand:+ start:258 stop:404 length:147 start_codon:yes stop_codon:yes gene_type:complete